jgi:hypothetical protein
MQVSPRLECGCATEQVSSGSFRCGSLPKETDLPTEIEKCQAEVSRCIEKYETVPRLSAG